MEITYFAVLREQRGLSSECIETDARTPRELYEKLRLSHGFSLDPAHVRAAVNGSFVAMNSPLGDGDHVVFIPPVAGG